MNTLIVIRHGNYNPATGRLSETGEKQIQSLGERIERLLGGKGSIYILSSTATRGVESARILSRIFDVDFEQHQMLWPKDNPPQNLSEVLELVRSKHEFDVIVLVTHHPHVEHFSTYFVQCKLDRSFIYRPVGEGQALYIDCGRKTVVRIG